MLCHKCRNNLLTGCSKFGKTKTDTEIRQSNYACFEPRIHKISTKKEINYDENVYLEEMTQKEINTYVDYKKRINGMENKMGRIVF